MHRFFIDKSNIIAREIELTGENAAHAHVLRLRHGEEIVVAVCGAGVDYFCAVTKTSKTSVTAEILREKPNNAELPLEVTLFQALPKGNKMGDIIENVTELGITRIYPVETTRCVARPTDKTARWQKIAESSAKLCHRGRIPKIHDAIDLPRAIEAANRMDAAFACYELEQVYTLSEYFNGLDMPNVKSIGFFIGPEGGFDEREVELFKENGIPAVTLGTRILRAQSASVMVMANINFFIQGMEK